MKIASAPQMRELDRRTIEEAGTPSLVLMDRAGLAVYQRLTEMLPIPGSVAVVCGKGNNGGDGFVVARLALTHGYLVDCLVAASESDLSPDAAQTLAAFRGVGGHPCFADSDLWTAKLESLAAHDLVVDALLGTGIHSEVRGTVADAIRAINAAETLVLSVDQPSGIDTDTGAELGSSVVADATVALGLAKPFLFCQDGLEHSGHWSVADIGLCEPSADFDELVDREWVAERLPIRDLGSNKTDHGHVLVIAGSHRFRGAALLSCLAALRTGAGLVTLAAPEEVCSAVASQLPEVMFLDRDPASILDMQSKFAVGLFGPGLGQSDEVKDLLSNVFRGWSRPALIDADALNLIGQGLPLPPGPCVMTPHPGELGRLMGVDARAIEHDRFASARAAAKKFGQCVLLKGRYSIIAGPGEPLLLNSTGNAGMATGGSGDTLSGAIASLMGQGLLPRDAAVVGAYLCGLAGDLCAESIGTIGYLPTEVAARIPQARDIILKQCEP